MLKTQVCGSCGQLMQILIYVPEMWNTCLTQSLFNMSPSTCEHIPTTRFDNVRQCSEYHLVGNLTYNPRPPCHSSGDSSEASVDPRLVSRNPPNMEACGVWQEIVST